jgi:hypothetical protein
MSYDIKHYDENPPALIIGLNDSSYVSWEFVRYVDAEDRALDLAKENPGCVYTVHIADEEVKWVPTDDE